MGGSRRREGGGEEGKGDNRGGRGEGGEEGEVEGWEKG